MRDRERWRPDRGGYRLLVLLLLAAAASGGVVTEAFGPDAATPAGDGEVRCGPDSGIAWGMFAAEGMAGARVYALAGEATLLERCAGGRGATSPPR